MANYNIIYDKQIPIETVRSDLESRGAVINTTLDAMSVMNISSELMLFTESSCVLSWEEDTVVNLELSYDWHQLRIVTPALPMRETYFPQNKGEGVSVYLVDSGIDASHEELVDANIVNVYTYDGSFSDSANHGTGLASIIVGKTLGVSPNATLKNIKIGVGFSITLGQLLEAFNAILVDNTDPVSVINCSWIIPKSQILDTKIIEMQSAGFVVVAAAGNGMQAADNYSPVGLDTVLGVGASDPYDRVISWGPGFGSNWGPEVDITAPGIEVEMATVGGGISSVSGTSVAAAVASGVAAQFIAKFPEKTASQIQDAIIANAVSDVLFRNESVYGTTPNLLLQTYVENDFLNNYPEDRLFHCKRGETTTVILDPKTDIVASIDLKGSPQIGSSLVIPPWVSFDQTTNTVTITPTNDVDIHKYRLYVCLYDQLNRLIQPTPMTINVYDENENENLSTEVYLHEQTLDSGVIVRLQLCYDQCPIQCTPLSKGAICACENTVCVES